MLRKGFFDLSVSVLRPFLKWDGHPYVHAPYCRLPREKKILCRQCWKETQSSAKKCMTRKVIIDWDLCNQVEIHKIPPYSQMADMISFENSLPSRELDAKPLPLGSETNLDRTQLVQDLWKEPLQSAKIDQSVCQDVADQQTTYSLISESVSHNQRYKRRRGAKRHFFFKESLLWRKPVYRNRPPTPCTLKASYFRSQIISTI